MVFARSKKKGAGIWMGQVGRKIQLIFSRKEG